LHGQTATWNHTFFEDTVYYKITGNIRLGKASIEAKYNNDQNKFKGNIIDGIYQGTWVFHAISGDTIVSINYDSLLISTPIIKYDSVVIDKEASKFRDNLNFTKNAITAADSILRYSFGNTFVDDHIYMHHGESKQRHYPRPHSFYNTELFEPHDKNIGGLFMIYSIIDNPAYWFAKVSLDSTLNIMNINFDPKRKYNIRVTRSKIDSIAKAEGWEEIKGNGYYSIISKPNLNLDRKEPIWSISYCLINEDWEKFAEEGQKCKYLVIHAESGEVKKTLSPRLNYNSRWRHQELDK